MNIVIVESMKRLLFFTLLAALLAACEPSPGPEAEEITPVSAAQIIVTVPISPTPNEAQLAATRFASTATPSLLPPTPIPSPTPYIGVFLGAVQSDSDVWLLGPPTLLPGGPALLPTANAAACPVPIDEAYLVAWQQHQIVSQAMGCPIQAAFGFFGQAQVFENGIMYRRDETGEVWAILPVTGGRGSYRYVERPESRSTAGISPPQGLRVPTGDFGSVWLGVEGLRTLMGFAQTDALRVELGLQRFTSGTFFLDGSSGQVFALVIDGTAYGPY